jgi:hypothetical protein
MKTEKAEIFNLFVESAMDAFHEYQNREKGSLPIMEAEKEKYSHKVFYTHFSEFITELKANINTYHDIYIVKDYVEAVFQYLTTIIPFHEDQNRWIIETGYEVEFLIKLKKDISFYIDEIKACTVTVNDIFCFGTTLRYYYDNEMKKDVRADEPEMVLPDEIAPEPEYQLENRFDFNDLKTECDQLTTAIDRINLINDRLFDFEQWQLQYDALIHDRDFGNYYELTAKYYSKFEDLCAIEIRRINKMVEIEQRLNSPTPISTEQTASPFKWNSSDTDFLELFAALYQNESIVRANGKPLTRKEMQEYFQNLLSLPIKDVEGKLTKAGNRNNNTVFLEKLAQQFRNYVSEKEAKNSRRK